MRRGRLHICVAPGALCVDESSFRVLLRFHHGDDDAHSLCFRGPHTTDKKVVESEDRDQEPE